MEFNSAFKGLSSAYIKTKNWYGGGGGGDDDDTTLYY